MTDRRTPALLVLLLCAFAVTVDTTIVNVALPTLSDELDASTRDLQWIVDAYTLVFAALVLAAGALGDRFGRREMLLAGLGVYIAGNAAGALVDSSGALIACRAVMGIGAALIFPATLSTIVHLYDDRGERAKAIGLWGATTGIAVALGPIVGGALLELTGWQSAFWLKVPIGAIAGGLALAYVPTSRDPARPPVDRVGLGLSTLAILLLVYTVIEAPERGWLSAITLAGFVVSALLLAGFVAYERRVEAPLLDVKLFRSGRLSAASLAVTLAFFALFGFIFLITQYFQYLLGYGAFETGVRLLPVALSTGTAAVLGTILAVRVGNKIVVATGLLCASAMFVWTSNASADTSYLEIAGQMILLGTGMGLTTAPATESIMGAIPGANAGVGSGMNDTTREFGGTLGVAVIGSVFASLYAAGFDGAGAVPAGAEDSIGAAFGIATEMGGGAGDSLRAIASAGFFDGLQAGCLVAGGVCFVGALAVMALLPSQPADEEELEAEPPAQPASAAYVTNS